MSVSGRSHLKAISLYTGLGGLDFGFEAAGYRTVVAVEIDPIACRMLAKHRRIWNVIQDDISNVTPSQILAAAQLKPKEADVLIGGPLACTRFRRHQVRCFNGTGGGSWSDGSLHASSSLKLCG